MEQKYPLLFYCILGKNASGFPQIADKPGKLYDSPVHFLNVRILTAVKVKKDLRMFSRRFQFLFFFFEINENVDKMEDKG